MPETYRTGSGRRISGILAERGERAAKSLGKNLYREGLGIMAESQPLVPFDTNTLRSSGYVAQPAREGDHITVELGYGGPAAKVNPKTGESADDYALYVHENLEAFHKVGTAKFLEMPFNQATPGMAARLADGMQRDLKMNTVGDYVVGDAANGEYIF